MERYLVCPINKMATSNTIKYDGDSMMCAMMKVCKSTSDVCIYDAISDKINTRCSTDEDLYIVKEKGIGALVGIYTKDKLGGFKNDKYDIYDFLGKKIYPSKTQRQIYSTFPYLDFTIPSTIPDKKEKTKPHGITLEIPGIEKMSNIEKVKAIEKIAELMRKEFGGPINVSDDYLKDVRFTVRKSFEEKEKDFYTSLETAQLSCPVGYSVFDVITGECVYVKEKSIYDFKKEAEQYKEMWDNLKSYINFLYSINECKEYNNILLRMKELEIKKEGIKNE